jgi:hypothetical protein
MNKLIKELDGAYLVRVFGDKVWAWHGGGIVLCYDTQGNETERLALPPTADDVFDVEDFLIDQRYPKDDKEELPDFEKDLDLDPTIEIKEVAHDDDDVLLTEETMCFDKFINDIVSREEDNKTTINKKLQNNRNLMKEYGDMYSEKSVNRFVVKGK